MTITTYLLGSFFNFRKMEDNKLEEPLAEQVDHRIPRLPLP